MKLSFIVTTYNIPVTLLKQCLQSIVELSLSPQEREIILIDDGSDLSPLDELLDFKNSILYLRQPNQGLSAARNIGLRVASGDYIQFIDGDDYLLRTPYEHCLDLMRYHNPDMVLFQETDKPVNDTPFAYEGPVSGTEYMHNHNLQASACGYIFRRGLLGSLRFTPGLLHEDEEFTPLLMLRAERVFTGKCKAYYYRPRKASITHEESKAHHLRRLSGYEHVLHHFQAVSATLPESERVALQRRIAQLTMDYLYNTIRLTHSGKLLNETIEKLHNHALFPLPDKNYTQKYSIFRKLISTRWGRRLLLITIH